MSEAWPAGVCDRLLGATGADGLRFNEANAGASKVPGLPAGRLVEAWREVQTTSRSDETPAIQVFQSYFNHISHNDFGRWLDFVEALVRDEPDEEIFMLAGYPMWSLFGDGVASITDRLATMAEGSARLRQLLGGVHWSPRGTPEQMAARERLAPFCDREARGAWRDRLEAAVPARDFEAMTLPEVATAWSELTALSPVGRERDRNKRRLDEFEDDLREDPDKALSLVLEILKLEERPMMLAMLAAGLMENLVPEHDGPLVDRIVAGAEGNPRLRNLLGGVWYSGVDEDVVARLKAVTGERW